MSSRDSQAPSPNKTGRRLALALLQGVGALIAAPVIVPAAYLVRLLKKLAAPLELPDGIPSKAEMKALVPHVGQSNNDAIRMWMRGALFYKLVEQHGCTVGQAAEHAIEIGNLANTMEGFRVSVEVVNGT